MSGRQLTEDQEIALRKIEAKYKEVATQDRISKRNARVEKAKMGVNFRNTTDRIYNIAYAGQVSLGWWNTLKPLLIGALILFFLIGPGLAAFQQIFGALNIWVWVGIIFIVILWWRNR